ncbi:MAG: hypothetical protein J7J88_00335 [Dehalococcoidia bacterium]|nr:hypothetical protein [Dehalococcoidia bacterium]
MPKLSHPKITKGQAIAYLLRLYRNEPAFMEELKQLREPYLEMVKELTKAWIIFGVRCAEVLTPNEFQEFRMDYLEGNEQFAKLPSEFVDYINQIRQKESKAQPYAGKLAELALRWKLKAPWAVPVLILFDMADILGELGLPEEIDIPIELFDFLYPFQPVLRPLEIKVSSLAFVFYDKREIMSQISKKLDDYETNLKKEGLKERPSAVKNHARWWFEHYVHRKKFDEIAQMECYAPGGSLISYAKNVATAVRRFSRLIDISPEVLK